jgi:hypothetical protein
MLNIVTWYYGDKYSPDYVSKLAAGVKRNLKQPYRFVVVSENARIVGDGMESWPIVDEDLLKVPGCLARLRMFDPTWQAAHGIAKGERIVDLDIDMVITGALDPLFDRPDPFVILQHINTTNPNPYNGSVFMLRAGERPDVWSDFSIEASTKIRYHAFPDDQGWFWHKIPDAGAWTVGDGIYGFKKVGWPTGDALPENARIVAFPGWRDPIKLGHLDWVAKHWVA